MTLTSQLIRDGAFILVLAAATCAVLIWLLMPLFRRYAMARPNARSSHSVPTPQGGGTAVIAGALVALAAAALVFTPFTAAAVQQLYWLGGSAIFLAAIGAADDIRPMDAAMKLFLQAVAVAAIVWSLPPNFHLVPWLPLWIERILLMLAAGAFVNFVNFMDGIDWMTVAEAVPVCAGVVFIALLGEAPADAALVALALIGTLVGFAPFNKPIARLFLGDVGSLPIGLLLFWLLLMLAAACHWALALLLPLYYLAETIITLLWRTDKNGCDALA